MTAKHARYRELIKQYNHEKYAVVSWLPDLTKPLADMLDENERLRRKLRAKTKGKQR